MKNTFTYILSFLFLAAAASSQSVELQLSPVKDCNDRSYCVDVQLQKSSLSAQDVTIGTSSILLSYDEAVLSFKNYVSKNFDENGACNGWSPQRYDAISRQGEFDLTLVLGQNSNACPVIGNAAITVGTVCFDIRQQGASPNIHFNLNHSQFNANDVDDGTEVVGISEAAFIDEKNLLVCDCSGAGNACDDGNIYTVNDRYDVNCNCLGEYADSDQDGILDGVDICLDQRYEAEDAEVFDVAFRNSVPKFCGLGYIDYLHNFNDYIEFSVNATEAGMHQLTFRYALETGNRPLELTLDGSVKDPEFDFPATGAWTNWGTVTVQWFLQAGPHLIRLTVIGSSGPNIDQLVLSFCSGCAETGQPCDDGNPCTAEDAIGLDCNCGGKYEDTDFDGICNVNDECEGFDDTKDTDGDGLPDGCDNCDNALIGTPCDDLDPCTINDKYISGCECLGTFDGADTDNDGVCDAYDICPNGNDAIDSDGDGIPDACDACDERTIGSPCDDNDPCTLLDVVTPNCGCSGFYYDSDGDGVCTTLDLCEDFDDLIDNDGDGFPDACDASIAISPKMEIGKAYNITDAWTTIYLENTYESMVVVATVILPNNDWQPVVTRVRNAEADKFQLRVQNPSEEVKSAYSIQFFVAEEGVYTLAQDGIKMEARKELSIETADATNYVREPRTYLQPYSNPVIVGQVMTFNDDKWSVFWSSRHNIGSMPADSVGFAAGKMVAEDTITTRLEETIGFVIVESGTYSRNGSLVEARLGENTIEGVWNSETGYTYQLNLDKPNHAVLSTSGINGGNGGWPVLFGDQLFRNNTMYLAFDEDQIRDSDRWHIAEEITYLAFEFVYPLAIAAVETENTTCFGGTDGFASVTLTGGETPYLYDWSNGDTTATIDGLAAGNYGVTITDANGTTMTASATISQPPMLDFNMQGSPISCFGANDGYAIVFSFGGSGQHTYQWSNGMATSEISGLPHGNYTVTISDENGCTEIGTYDVVEPPTIALSGSTEDASCFDGTDGVIKVEANGGTGLLSYAWNTGESTPNLSNVSAGNYVVTVTDDNGCEEMADFEVQQPPQLEADATTTFTSCNGGNDGTATASYSGGTGSVTYEWSNGETTETIAGLSTGSYSVTIMDANGCTATASANVTDPSMLSVEIAATDAACEGVGNGVAEASFTGGTGNVTYLWSNGEATSTISNLFAGEYSVTVTDANGCTATASTEVDDPTLLDVEISATNAACEGVGNGLAEASYTGGTGNVTYLWSNGETTPTISNLFAGGYSVTATDENGCEAVSDVEITIAGALTAQAASADVNCFGGSDGVVDLTPFGATPPYDFNWSNGSTESSIWQVPAGVYSVTVTSWEGCEFIDTFAINEPDELILETDQTNVSCFGGMDGTALATASGGSGNFSYQWSTMETTPEISNLPAGEYSIVVQDSNACDTSMTIVISEPDQFEIMIDSVLAAVGTNADGAIDISVSGGTPSYTFEWYLNNDLIAEVEDPTDLVAGEYTLILTDANGCETSQTVVVESVTSVEGRDYLRYIRLSPNPTSGQFTLFLDLPNEKNTMAAIFDISGKTVISEVPVHARYDFDLTNEATGVYLLRIKIGEVEVTKRVVVVD